MNCVDARDLVRVRMSHVSDAPSLLIRRCHRRLRRQFHINFDMLQSQLKAKNTIKLIETDKFILEQRANIKRQTARSVGRSIGCAFFSLSFATFTPIKPNTNQNYRESINWKNHTRKLIRSYGNMCLSMQLSQMHIRHLSWLKIWLRTRVCVFMCVGTIIEACKTF